MKTRGQLRGNRFEGHRAISNDPKHRYPLDAADLLNWSGAKRDHRKVCVSSK